MDTEHWGAPQNLHPTHTVSSSVSVDSLWHDLQAPYSSVSEKHEVHRYRFSPTFTTTSYPLHPPQLMGKA